MRRLSLMLLAALLAGCGAIVSQTFTEVGDSLPTPTPAVSPSAEDAAGTFTLVDAGGPLDGPGITLAEAIANADGEPKLVAGVLLMDRDGVIWLCEEITDSSPPACGEPRLRVENYPQGGAEWNLEDAEITGLQEEDGVLWFEDNRLYGEVQP
jgi:hypothetical protein